MASNHPSNCCTVGVRHEGESTGSTIKIADGIETYIAEPKGKINHKDSAILFLPDVIGIWQNSTLIADQYAANGYYTMMPDIFNGDALTLNRPEGFDFMAWMRKGTGGNNPHTLEAIDPIVEKAIKYLKEKGFKKICSVGYCFGAKYTVRFMHEGKGIDAGFVAHPSFVQEEELSKITGPFSIAAAETDEIFPAEKRHISETILVETKQPYQINLYSGVRHGFSVRCDVGNKIERYAKEQAFLQAIFWFNEHLI